MQLVGILTENKNKVSLVQFWVWLVSTVSYMQRNSKKAISGNPCPICVNDIEITHEVLDLYDYCVYNAME